MLEVYQCSLLGLWLILSTIIIQSMVAVRIHRRQKGGYMPGIIKPELNHSSIVFRTYKFNDYFITLLNTNFSADDDIHSNTESFSILKLKGKSLRNC